MGHEGAGIDSPNLAQPLEGGLRAVLLRCAVELGAVASRENRRLGRHGQRFAQTAQSIANAGGIERKTLAQVERGAAVVESNGPDVHQLSRFPPSG